MKRVASPAFLFAGAPSDIRLRGNGTTNFGNGAGTSPTAATFDLNPLILSAGIRFGF